MLNTDMNTANDINRSIDIFVALTIFYVVQLHRDETFDRSCFRNILSCTLSQLLM